MARVLPPPTVPTHLNYYITPENGGQKFWYPGTAGNFRRPQDVRPVNVTDVRQVDDKITLDVHGFQVVNHESEEKTFDNDERLRSGYYSETAEMLKKETGATHVYPISHFIRKMGWKDAVAKSEDLDDLTPLPGGVSGAYCHVDQSYQGATELLSDNLTDEEVDRLTRSRWGIINVWRPINQTVKREPLAMCDARSVDESDLYPVRLHILPQGSYKNITDGKSFEAWAIAANDKHKWYYASELTPEECVLIKCYDSKLDGRARRCPHTAFNTHLDEGPPRESIEMRCLVFWEDQARD